MLCTWQTESSVNRFLRLKRMEKEVLHSFLSLLIRIYFYFLQIVFEKKAKKGKI